MDSRLTPALINYLDGVASVLREKRVARIRDIALVCDVRVPSVCSAMNRLSKMGHINYETGEYITLTKIGRLQTKQYEKRRIFLERFFLETVKMDQNLAKVEARSFAPFISDEAFKCIVSFLDSYRSTGVLHSSTSHSDSKPHSS